MSLRPLYAIDQQDVAGCGAQRPRQGRDAGRHARDVVAGGASPGIRGVAWRVCAGTGVAVVLVGYCAGWLPWFADIDRQMYFYAATMAPFLVMGISLVLGDILSPGQGLNDAHWG